MLFQAEALCFPALEATHPAWQGTQEPRTRPALCPLFPAHGTADPAQGAISSETQKIDC